MTLEELDSHLCKQMPIKTAKSNDVLYLAIVMVVLFINTGIYFNHMI